MNFDTIWKIALAVVGAAGGYGALVLLGIKFSANLIADRLEKKYELKLSKELEKYKSKLEKKTYITKTRFDTEFNIYRELSQSFFELDLWINTLIPPGLNNRLADSCKQNEVDNRNYQNSVDAILKAQNTLYQNYPFISEQFTDQYKELISLARTQTYEFEQRWNVLNFDPQKDKLDKEAYKRSQEIHKKLIDLNTSIRDYLDSLEVIE